MGRWFRSASTSACSSTACGYKSASRSALSRCLLRSGSGSLSGKANELGMAGGIPPFDSKYEVEEHIAKIGVRATVLAPVYFMENLHFGKQQLAKGIYATPLPPTRQLAQVAVADIGAVAVRLLEEPLRRQALRP